MELFQILVAAAALLAIAAAMALYEWSRVKAKRPLFNGHPIVTLYWCAYLSLFVLGVTTVIAAVVRWA
jgi:hypothetical protein